METLRIAIMGRPNVGKSSVFNALLGRKRSIVLGAPGTTVDLIVECVSWGQRPVELIDSEGIFVDENKTMIPALETAHLYLLVVDAKSGLHPYDRTLVCELQKRHKPVLVCVNKSEGKKRDPSEFYELGIGDIAVVSAAHRSGFSEIKEWCMDWHRKLSHFSDCGAALDKSPLFTLALVGKPNTGKSTLMNRLCHQYVSKVDSQALTTRDAIGFELSTDFGRVRLLDTAGLRRPARIQDSIEKLSVLSTRSAIRSADVVFVLLASHEGVSDQDRRLIQFVAESGKPAALLFNFWDRLTPRARNRFIKNCREEFAELLRTYTVLPMSALKDKNPAQCLPLALKLFQKSGERIPTSRLNKILKTMIAKNPPPSSGAGFFNILYASQVKTKPPTFVFFMNRKGALPRSYQRFLTNQIRQRLGLKSQAIRLHFRAG